ncbi:GTP cyclohydrolase 1, partial [Mucuna pruriens]
MGHLDQSGVSMCCDEECFEKESTAASIKEAVKVLLMGLGEDINREGIIKTPLRVAKALCEGTRGE